MGSTQAHARRATRSDVDLVLSASSLFATPPTPEWTEDFLDRGSNLLLLALDLEKPVGILVGVETGSLCSSPDLFIYEIRVREAERGQGIAHMMIAKAVDIARESGCMRVWGSLDHGDYAPLESPWAPPESVTAGATTFMIPLD